jgi:hypothetical protein
MASFYSPECRYEIPVSDLSGYPIHEVHEKSCKCAPLGPQRVRFVTEHKKFLDQMAFYPTKEKF